MTDQHSPQRDPVFDEDFDDLDASAGEGSNWHVVLGLVIAVALVGYVIMDGFEAETYFYTVDQAVDKGDALIGETVRVKGLVEAGSIEGEAGQLHRAFRLVENGKSMRITYDRAVPDTFEDGVEVVAEGTVDADFTLAADNLMVKCPSRYEGENPDFSDEEFDGPRAQR